MKLREALMIRLNMAIVKKGDAYLVIPHLVDVHHTSKTNTFPHQTNTYMTLILSNHTQVISEHSYMDHKERSSNKWLDFQQNGEIFIFLFGKSIDLWISFFFNWILLNKLKSLTLKFWKLVCIIFSKMGPITMFSLCYVRSNIHVSYWILSVIIRYNKQTSSTSK